MKKLIIFGIVAVALFQYFKWQPSTEVIANNMGFGEPISYNGQLFYSDWTSDLESIKGYVRRIDRQYDKNIPIITYSLLITTGDFNDPNLVKIRHKGGGNYSWSANTKPNGSLIVYHTIPNNVSSQDKLNSLKEGDSVEILAKMSRNSELKASDGGFFKLLHTNNHKIIRVDDIRWM